MRILIIRHGEPDYELDCLTENGIFQAKKLGERLKTIDISAVYTSTMGRARQTAQIAMEGRGLDITECDWLREFNMEVHDKDLPEAVPVWDILPKNWTKNKICFDKDLFYTAEGISDSMVKERYDAVCKGVDSVLAEHGLERQGEIYHVTKEHDKTIAFFCHFGATCVTLSHLIGISPIVTLQGFSAEPTAITTVCTDDRFGKDVNFRIHGFGDIHHLGENLGGSVNYK